MSPKVSTPVRTRYLTASAPPEDTPPVGGTKGGRAGPRHPIEGDTPKGGNGASRRRCAPRTKPPHRGTPGPTSTSRGTTLTGTKNPLHPYGHSHPGMRHPPPVETPQQEAQAPPQTMPPRGVGHSPRITPCLREDAGRSSSRVPSCGHLLLSRSRSPRPVSSVRAHPSRSHSRSAFLRLSLWGASRRAFLGAVSSGLGGALLWGGSGASGWVLSGLGVVGVRGVLCLRADLPSACGVGLLRLRLF